MSITDKTRKTLWAKSGNRCSLCRVELVQEMDESKENLIIGEECHLVSSKPNGPRGNIEFEGDYDGYNNLILLCANDHKRVDEMVDIYPFEKLKQIKEIHEAWVRSTLEKDVTAFANEKQNIKSLPKITSGKQLIDIIRGAHMFDFNHDELKTEEEANAIGLLFEELQDYGDILAEIGFTEVARLGLYFTDEIKKLNAMGFLLFGLQRRLRLRNDKKEDLGLYETASIIIVRASNPGIIGEFLIAKFPTNMRFNT